MRCSLCEKKIIKGKELIFLDEVYITRTFDDTLAKHQDNRIVADPKGVVGNAKICKDCLESIGFSIVDRE